jgi:UDPglucose 6-dehydrogenase
MRVCVAGLWHLGCVTAACLSDAGHDVIALDSNVDLVAQLRDGTPPLFEPGLEDLIRAGLRSERLSFESDLSFASRADVVWITFDTPVDEDDKPHPSTVVDYVVSLCNYLTPEALVLISSQLPVGTTRRLVAAGAQCGRADVSFGYSPENLRLGHAIEVFSKPDRVVMGLQNDRDRERVSALLAPFTTNILWMGIEAAEMTKHAINAFLATSVVFMNEIGAICEQVGADAKDVERGLKSEERIGPRAYLSPGGAFAGGTLARDVTTLADLSAEFGLPSVLVSAVRESNNQHRAWPLRKLKEALKALPGRRVAILGLTYTPGTSTLRRSSAVELALELQREGVQVVAFDPGVEELPLELAGRIGLEQSAADALNGSDAVVIATAWPQFRDLPWLSLLATMRRPTVIDANWYLAAHLRNLPGIAYTAVGLPWSGG